MNFTFNFHLLSADTCAPLTEIQINGRICVCDSTGVWSEANCYLAERRGLCQPGQIVTQGCSQCICQEDGKLSCAEQTCSNPVDMNHQTLTTAIHWCTPFRAYYVSCNICLCPASGLTIEANCAFDTSCTLTGQPSKKEIAAKKSICIQNVMYLFNCLHCLCGEDGFFSLENCIETCANPLKFEDTRRCVPKTYYRHDCNVCKCPDNGIPDDKHCTKAACGQDTNLQLFLTLRNMSLDCTPNTFTNAHCLYCECDSKGKMDEKLCLGLECLDFDEFKYDVAKDTCTYGEMVPVCIECFCLRHGQTTEEYCTKGCSYQNKVNVLERVLKDSVNNAMLIGHDSIKEISSDDKCEPNTIYKDEGKFCICPGNAVTNFNLCTVTEENDLNRISKVPENINIDFNISCEPSTFVDFDCNTCFCSKKGKIDPKWCTYDDCKAKKITQMKHENAKPSISTANAKPSISTAIERSNKCTPGTISIEDCNFCICPDNAVFIDKVCTKNDCSSFTTLPANNNFICEPLAYYEVDCNVCFCPRDGLKNVAKCTKNHCEKSYLRSEVCVPGQLFTDECNVCVCPPNGNKADKACTNYTCPEEAQWKKIYQLSETLLGNQVSEDATRKLDLCFPGEEFIVGCKVCVCPDMGLRAYATCSSVLCNGHDVKENVRKRVDLGIMLFPYRIDLLTPKGFYVHLSTKENINLHYPVTRLLHCLLMPQSDVSLILSSPYP